MTETQICKLPIHTEFYFVYQGVDTLYKMIEDKPDWDGTVAKNMKDGRGVYFNRTTVIRIETPKYVTLENFVKRGYELR